ncbi:MAG: sigma-70 family RNA polymerase sigma factor [Gammaproteobacteria bacterium]|nr:sigma-70 family RNA polymerase sigma factor [Gammaproteobacteria bacterium]
MGKQEQHSEEIALLRDEMLRFATLQLRDAVMAEDIVHDAINAALSSGKYKEQGSLRNWLYAILRNKIIDVFRDRSRHPTVSFTDDDGRDIDISLDEQFDQKGHWKKDKQPANWGHPEKAMANNQFWQVFEACLNQLPENTARVFMMREHLGLDIKEICNELHLSDSNAWVIMHRARSLLRLCLETNFAQGSLA